MTEGTITASTAATDPPSAPADAGEPPRPRKQEQERATTEITEVAPGVLRLQLPIDLPGLGHVNTYALEDGDGFALVDPGLPGEQAWNDLNDRMQRAGIPLSRVHSVIVTHSHPDHFGGAGLLAEETGARIVTSEQFRTFWDMDDEELAARDPADESPPVRRIPKFNRPTPWGGLTEGPPPERRKEMEDNIEQMLRWFRVPVPAVRLVDMDTISLAGREWFGLFTGPHQRSPLPVGSRGGRADRRRPRPPHDHAAHLGHGRR